MTREEAKKMLPLIKAYSEGKIIEWYSSNFDKWEEQGENCGFEFSPKTYRIKPEPKYRPFKNAEECWNEMLKHQPFGWMKDKEDGSKVSLTCIEKDGDISINGNKGWKYDGVMKIYTFADGSVFGVKEE